MTRSTTPIFSAKQLTDEIAERSYLMPTEIEVYIKNLIRLVEQQDRRITQLEHPYRKGL